LTSIRAATPAELADWDERAVDGPGGHVLQSLAWAAHREATGWTADRLVFDDGFRLLALRRTWPIVGGSSAYIPRGPIPADEPAERTAERLAAVTAHLAGSGVAVVASDAEVPAASGYPARLRAIGFHPIEEIQPSRHRLSLGLAGRAEDDVFAAVSKSTRQRVRRAEEEGLSVVRHDGRVAAGGVGEGFARAAEPSGVALDRFYDLLLETGERRQFSFGPRAGFLAWWRAALAAGHLVYLEARASLDDEVLAGLVLYRHGDRLTTVHSGDRDRARRDHPGALHLLRWRAIQLAVREGRTEMDLGGVDVAGQRREPREGEPMWGLYQHKRSFGAQWLELAGAHERVLDPKRYRLGRVAGAVSRAASRLRR
jgi:lipid II:glycine glycyltransferase (peptidoglycan interpeptide bridge formation enzyme)